MCGLFVWSLKYELAVNETLRYVTCLSDLHDLRAAILIYFPCDVWHEQAGGVYLGTG